LPEPSASPHAWAEAHGVVLSVVTTDDPTTWHVEARTQRGCLELDVATDGYQPDPFDCLFGTWADETPGDAEYYAAGEVLGPDALADLAVLVGWL
jgi:hypothetical protein